MAKFSFSLWLLPALFGFARSQCVDLLTIEGKEWFDDVKAKYSCANYYTPKASTKCSTDGKKYMYLGMRAVDACCACGGGSTSAFGLALAENSSTAPVTTTSAVVACVPQAGWTHPSYGDNCGDYRAATETTPAGASYKFRCDPVAAAACCSCVVEATGALGGSSGSNNASATTAQCFTRLSNGRPWLDAGGFGCKWYKKNEACGSYANDYMSDGLTANDACCECGGGQKCLDYFEDGLQWHDMGGLAYNCSWYAIGKRCSKFGSRYPSVSKGTFAKDACCACGGGTPEDSSNEASGIPLVNTGNEMSDGPEYVGTIQFNNKKHLQSGFLLYWNLNSIEKVATFALLSPEGFQATDSSWLGLGFARADTGGMAGSDVVLGWSNNSSPERLKPVLEEYWLKTQAQSGIVREARIGIFSPNMVLIPELNRVAMVFNRPFVPRNPKGLVTPTAPTKLSPDEEFVNIVYASGGRSSRCVPFCNHAAGKGFTASVALKAPEAMSLSDLNAGRLNEPCQGEARLICDLGLTCVHNDSATGDIFAEDYSTYGVCLDPASLGDAGSSGENNFYPQKILTSGNNGGFERNQTLLNGFHLFWSIINNTEDNTGDRVVIAFISANPKLQGWIGFGFSPNGEMKGSDVVIGWNDGNGNTGFGDYYLSEQVSNANSVSNRQGLSNTRIISKNGQTGLWFERPITDTVSVQILEGDMNIIYAAGPMPNPEDNGNFIPYHRYRRAGKVQILPYSADEFAKAQENEFCAGSGSIQCRRGLDCPLITQAFIDNLKRGITVFNRTRNGTAGNGTRWNGTANDAPTWPGQDVNVNAGRPRGNLSRVMNDPQELLGSGICSPPGSDILSFNLSAFASEALDRKSYNHSLALKWGFTLYWSRVPGLSPLPDRLRIALVATGQRNGWIGLGFGLAMTGSRAVIGFADSRAATPRIEEFFLNQKVPWEILPLSPGQEGMDVSNLKVASTGRQIALEYERAFDFDAEPSGGTGLIYAIGNFPKPVDTYFGYHYYRDLVKVRLNVRDFTQ